jgi:bifunctional DNA-binding transcriptional regulator/antitoxin component of YhaV-PrlF toxin-antitoxin module
MVNATFFTELLSKKNLEIPSEVANSLSLEEGDRVEVFIKKIRSKRRDIKISRNPLNKLLELKP